MSLDPSLLHDLAAKAGTPFWLYEAGVVRQRIADVRFLTDGEGMQARFAMKACPATKVLREMQAAGIWIDAVSGNEVLRARHAGFAAGAEPPAGDSATRAMSFATTRCRSCWSSGILPNAGSPGMLAELASAGYRGPVSLRMNPGFGHGHVNACDTGGPSSKHGIWFAGLAETMAEAQPAAG